MLILCIIGVQGLLGQSRATVAEVEKTEDIRVVAHFIKHYPNHPDVPKFKAKLYHMLNSPSTVISKPKEKNTPMVLNKGYVSSSPEKTGLDMKDAKIQKTVDLLNHLFSSDRSNRREAYLLITNKSKCGLVMKVEGAKTLYLTVPALSSDFLQIEKGNYTLSAKICNAQYYSKKSLYKDTEITLGNK